MSISGLAYRAAQIMSERGHCKGSLGDAEGRVCFEGALRLAAGEPLFEDDLTEDSPAFDERWADVSAVALRILDDRGYNYGPVAFNDLDETTGEDIILLLKECGKRLEETDGNP